MRFDIIFFNLYDCLKMNKKKNTISDLSGNVA